MEPTLYDIPPDYELAAIAVTTSPAPLANANKVTAPSASGNLSHSDR